MHRFYLPPEQCNAERLSLTGGEAHHAMHVLRLRPGDRVYVLDGAGHEFACDIKNLRRDAVELDVVSSRSEPRSELQITLIQALPKARLIESIIQKATELGASRLQPIFTERVVTHFGTEEAL